MPLKVASFQKNYIIREDLIDFLCNNLPIDNNEQMKKADSRHLRVGFLAVNYLQHPIAGLHGGLGGFGGHGVAGRVVGGPHNP